jgi:hypothetical protein
MNKTGYYKFEQIRERASRQLEVLLKQGSPDADKVTKLRKEIAQCEERMKEAEEAPDA